MGIRFTKRVKLLPGVTLNISKTGASVSVGPKGNQKTKRRNSKSVRRSKTFRRKSEGCQHCDSRKIRKTKRNYR